MSYILGFDIGGTFTDFSLLNTSTSALQTYKCLTTPKDLSLGVMEGVGVLLAQANISMAELERVYHATTLVANTLIERNGATVALLCTHGHRDVLDIRTEQRYDVYDLFLQYPAPLVPRYLRLPVRERTDREGRVIIAPSYDDVASIAKHIAANKVEAVAIAFLHSYRNPANEAQVAQWLQSALAQLNPHIPIPISLSCEIAPEIREYERTSTTVANAYVQPKVHGYLSKLETALKEAGYGGRLYLTLSSGGSASAYTAAQHPIRLVESGPAAGAVAAAYFGAQVGKRDLVAFDMGGTTAKICVIENGVPELARQLEVARLHRFKKGSGIPLQFPSIDMIEIGAGGGSIAKHDRLGLLKIGPESASSDPGPACYGLGGTLPTVTDANLLLGYLNPHYFAGGKLNLHTALAQQSFANMSIPMPAENASFARTITDLAWAVHLLVNENMATAAKIHIIEKGRDPRNYALLAYGGGGPLHGAGVAKILGAREVICPPSAGVGSAIGLLVAPMSFAIAQSYPVTWDAVPLAKLNNVLNDMERKGRAQLDEAGVTGDITIERSADGRFVGQLHELNIRLPNGDLTPAKCDEIHQAFFAHYREKYGHVPRNASGEFAPIEFISWRITVRGPQSHLSFEHLHKKDTGTRATKGSRRAYFGEAGWRDTPVYDRYGLADQSTITGPAIIEERESTIIVPPDLHARVVGQYVIIQIAPAESRLNTPEIGKE